MEKKRLLLIDSNALLHRAFHALPPLSTKDGKPVGAVYGFLLTFFKAIKDILPHFVVAAFDFPAPTFRHKKYKEYKAKRKKPPDEFYKQIPFIKEILSTFSIPICEKEGFEADDIIATLVEKALKENPNLEIYILTGDLDTLQLVSDKVKVYTLGRKIKESIIYDREKVKEKYGILPSQIVDFKALAGDPSDNIPGAPGIGKKTAIEILKKFKSLKKLYEVLEKEKKEVPLKEKIKKSLLDNKEQILFSQVLAKTRKDVPLEISLKDCVFGNFNSKKVEEVFKKYEFFSLIKRLPEILKSLKTRSEGTLF